MLYSNFFGKTEKTIPSDIKSISHKLLYKGGFIRQISAGRYAFLPLGFRVWKKIYKVIQDEMDALGCQQVHTPTLHPIELWKATNRDKAFGGEMLVVEDHQKATFAIGATAEGLMVELVKKFKPSYKDLPIVIYQFVEKFRDEKRPRGGLLRVREFMMKDAYSFHATEKDLLDWYDKFYKAYEKIAERMGLAVIPVIADSGAIGGDYNHEFMVLSSAGEDTVLVCNRCDYAANLEKAESIFPPFKQDEKKEAKKDVKGEGIIGVAALSKFLKIPIEKTTKTLLYNADGKIVAACIRGDYNINEKKLAKTLAVSSLKLASEEVVKKVTGSKIGYAGPLNLPKTIKIIWDKTTEGRVNFEAGANRENYHTVNINFRRDVDNPKKFFDIREVKEAEICTVCKKGGLKAKKAIEFGHVFKQDHFYTKPMKGNFIDKDGKEKPLWMGAYGIGIGRAMAAVVETYHDEMGIVWPDSIAPFHVHMINLKKDIGFANKVYNMLIKENIEVLFDDRDVSAGEKFADADLLGIPYRLVVSEKTGDKIEMRKRNENKIALVSSEDLLDLLR